MFGNLDRIEREIVKGFFNSSWREEILEKKNCLRSLETDKERIWRKYFLKFPSDQWIIKTPGLFRTLIDCRPSNPGCVISVIRWDLRKECSVKCKTAGNTVYDLQAYHICQQQPADVTWTVLTAVLKLKECLEVIKKHVWVTCRVLFFGRALSNILPNVYKLFYTDCFRLTLFLCRKNQTINKILYMLI